MWMLRGSETETFLNMLDGNIRGHSGWFKKWADGNYCSNHNHKR